MFTSKAKVIREIHRGFVWTLIEYYTGSPFEFQ